MFKGLYKNDATRRRYQVLAVALFAWMLVIGCRLVWVQIVRHEHWDDRAQSNQRRVQKTVPPRGDIVDRNGRSLAMNVHTEAVFADLDMLQHASHEDRERVVENLAPLLGFSQQDMRNKLQTPAARNEGVLYLKRKLTPAFATELRMAVRRHRLRGIGFARATERRYPNEWLASHLIGAVSRGEVETGIEGLEQKYQKQLTGIAGRIELAQDAKGNAWRRSELPAKPGARIVTTLDFALQHKIEVLLNEAIHQTKARSATAIVLDPANGEVLALANAPAFNPNERLTELTDGLRYLRKNRALTDIYEPGSVFKLVAYAGALEEKLIQPDSPIDCQGGVLRVAGRLNPVRDSHLGLGTVTAEVAFAKSSNVGAIKMGQALGKERLIDYARKFGFLNATGFELPENKGTILPDIEWKYGAIGVVPMGQGVTVTALQAVAAYAAIANRGVWMQPHVVKEIVNADGIAQPTQPRLRRVVSPTTAAQLAQMMRHVVGEGTGKAAGPLADYTAAGKTGTAQKAVKGRGYTDNKFIASFVGFVPATQPRFAIIVVLDEPQGMHQGGQVCAPIFNLIAEAALITGNVAPDDETFRATLAQLASKAAEATPTPLPTMTPMAQATPIPLVSSNVTGNVTGASAPVNNQPARDHVVAVQAMPDLQGKGAKAVMQVCTRLQLRMHFDGAGQAIAQTPLPGARIKPGDLCKVKFQ